jgi:hypothetical protein
MFGRMNSEFFGGAPARRPEYKSHPLWIEAMSLTREVYALSERLRACDPERSLRLRKAAVAVPAHVASALSAEPQKRTEPMHAARAALAEVSEQASRTLDPWAGSLVQQAHTLDRSVLFEFGAPEVSS